ncbi:MAG TPA: dienelactone hydrolase family protein [Pyrinomonadaceae bacterium]|jgi:poly(3-hydroxybutyrate) depolymerase
MSVKTLARVLLALPPLLLLLLAPAAARADGKVSKETLESGGRKRTYYLYAPPSLKPAAALVVMLHGSGRNGLSLVEKWKDLAEREGFVIAGPDAVESRGWRSPEDGPDFIRDLVEALRRRFDINARRVYLFGHSAGAVFALNLSMLESEYFAAAAVHAGSWRSQEEFAALAFARRKIPLAIIVGDRDAFFPVDSVRATEAALKERGFDIAVTVVKGHDHWYYDRASEFNRDAWEFLKRHELGEDPKYKVYASADGGGGAGGDDFNAAVKEINALRAQAGESWRRFYAKEEELRSKDRAKEEAAVALIAREQLQLLEASAAAYRESARRAEAAGGRKLPGNYAQYFSTIARADARRAEALDAMVERAKLLLGDEPPDARVQKMNAAVVKSEKLHREADELEREAERVKSGQGP